MFKLIIRLIQSLILIGMGVYIGHVLVPETIDSIGDAYGFDGIMKSAKAGDAKSQFLVSEAFKYGKGVDRNSQQALYWLKESASNGYVRAQLELAHLYEMGMELPQDKMAALKIYQKIAGDAFCRLNKTDSALF